MFKTLAARLSLLFGLLFLLFSLFAFKWYVSISQSFSHEVKQKLHNQLAEHLIHDSPSLQRGVIDPNDLKQVFHTQMLLGPEWEFYALDSTGKIVAYSAPANVIKLNQVEISPLMDFLNGAEYPIYGDDPRTPSSQKIFSVAPIYTQGGDLSGYLYVIIGGQKWTNLVDLLSDSQVLKNGLLILVLSIVFAVVVLFVAIYIISSPIKQLSRQLHSFVDSNFSRLPEGSNTWFTFSELQNLQRDINSAAGHINEQFKQIKTTEELRRELLSHISHDFRTPLTALNGYLETWIIAKNEQKDPKLVEYALKNGHQISQLVDALFDLARLEGGDIKTHFERINVAELCHDILQKLKYSAQKLAVSLQLDCYNQEACLLWADIAKLERILVNLIDNAVRHSPPQSIVIVKIQSAGDQIRISVIDQGRGIPENEIKDIFTAKYQASNSRSLQHNGGLGLAIVRHLLQLHQTDIQVKSCLNQGSEFSFLLFKNLPAQ